MNPLKRYCREEMFNLFSEEAKLNRWLQVEIAVLKVREKRGLIPPRTTEEIIKKSRIDVDRIHDLEKVSRHDMLAFVQSIEEQIGDLSQFLHLGLTSYDIEDTALGLLFKEAGKLLIESLDKVLFILKEKALQNKNLLIMGRTHGIHAEPISLGIKMLGWYSSLMRDKNHILGAVKEVSYGKLSGAVGNYAFISPDLEKEILDYLGLEVEPLSTQIIPRDRIAYLISTMALAASNVERISLQIRLLQQSELDEIREPFYKGQKGSSAMPHKRNPVLSERLCGISRLIRSRVNPVIENVSLWHERDISHSSVERFVLPEVFILLDYMYVLLFEIFKNLDINLKAINKNLKKMKGFIHSESFLVILQKKGYRRSQAYQIVQSLVQTAIEKDMSLIEVIRLSPELKLIISDDELEMIESDEKYLAHVDEIFRRFFNNN